MLSVTRYLYCLAQAQAHADQRRQVVQGDHVRTIAEGLVRPGVRLQEQAVATGRHGGAGQVGDHAPIATAA